MEEEQTKDFQDYIIAIRKRKAAILSIFSVILFLTAAIAFLLPAIYQSGSTILIEQQEIPTELVRSTVTSFASERIQTIQARIMSRTNLLKIIDKFELYEDERKVKTSEEIVARMKSNVDLNMISANVVDPRTGRASTATIAFSLSFTGENPSKVQRVANELTTLYLEKNISTRTEEAAETSVFFDEEAKRLSTQLNELEEKIAIFKQEHSNALPEVQKLNLGVLQRQEAELRATDTTLENLEERKFYLKEQLLQLDPGNTDIPGAVEKLKLLKSTYVSARSQYTSEHPNVVRLKNEIASLEKEVGASNDATELAESIRVLTNDLVMKRENYSGKHPDIIALESRLAALNIELSNRKNNPVDNYYKSEPDNPLYITTRTQILLLEGKIKSIKQQRENTLSRIEKVELSLYQAPQVERQYRILKRDYGNAYKRYQETKSKKMQADVSIQLESESKGENFTLIEPANLPEKPISPNRPAIVFLGFILALGSSLGFAIVADAISGTVRGARSIERYLGVLPLAVIPYELNLQEELKTKRIKKRVVLLFFVIIFLAVLLLHFFVSPLDVLWFRVLRKIDVLMA